MWPSPQAASAWQRPGLTRKCGLPDIHWCQVPPCTRSHWPARRAWGPSPPPPQNGRTGRLHSHPTVYTSPRWLWPAAHRVTARQKAGGACSTRGSRLPTGRVGAGTWGPVGAVLTQEKTGGLADMGRPRVSPPWRHRAGPGAGASRAGQMCLPLFPRLPSHTR